MGKPSPITDDQRKVLETARDNPNKTPTEIARLLNDPALGAEYVDTVLNTYELESDKTSLAQITLTPSSPTNTTQMDDTNYDPDAYDISTTALEGSYPSDHLGTKAKAFVWYVRENPDATRDEIAEAIGATRSTVNSYVRYYSHLIPKDTQLWTGATRPETKGLKKLTDKQKEVVQLTYEMPDATVGELGENSDSTGTNAQVVTKTYAHLLHPQFRRNNPQLLEPHGDVIENPHDHRSPEHLEKLYEASRGDRDDEPETADTTVETEAEDEDTLTTEELEEKRYTHISDHEEDEDEAEPDAYPGSRIVQVDGRILDRLADEATFHLETAAEGGRVDYAAGMVRVLEEIGVEMDT